MKTCHRCRAAKPAIEFYVKLGSKDGLQSYCKSCHGMMNRLNHAANPERRKEVARNWRADNYERYRALANKWEADNLVHRRAKSRAWRVANKERNRARQLAWQAANPEKLRAIYKRYSQANPERTQLAHSLRRARKQANGICVVTIEEIKRLLGRPCYLCGAKSTSIDHIIPIARGGRHSIGNLLGACGPCNSQKHSKFLIEHLQCLRSRQNVTIA